MAPVDAHLMFIDGHTIKVRVPHPPPKTFTLAQGKVPDRVLVLRRYSRNGAIYCEQDRRKAVREVQQDRRKPRNES
jgi:hypothetical protein